MKNADKKILIGILAIFIGVSSAHLFAKSSQLQAKKTWEFKPQQGIVKIGLLVDSSFPQAPSLEILYENDAHPALAEERDFIREVLHQLPGLGVDPRNVRSISMRGFAEPDVMERIAIAALHSKAWQSRAEVVG